MRIIVEQLEGHWSAWQKSSPETALGGSDAVVAVKRLCATIGLERRIARRGSDRVPRGPLGVRRWKGRARTAAVVAGTLA
jgi:hypothetical protein